MEEESFYQEANDMQDGWGDYLKKIDLLQIKVEDNAPLDIREACYALYGNSLGNGGYREKFMQWIEKELPDKKFTWNIWKNLFIGWTQDENHLV